MVMSSVNHKYIVKVRPFLSAKIVDMFDYTKPMQRAFNPDVYILHVIVRQFTGTNIFRYLEFGQISEIKQLHFCCFKIVAGDDVYKRK